MIQQVADLKEYIAFEISNLKKHKTSSETSELLTKLKEENRFLRNEIQETRKLLNNILENIVSENSGHK